MSDSLGTGRDFETDLRREVERVLADPAFQRSPVQSRLLAYLCDQTVSRNRNISQIAIAVDGLGRPETAEVLTESYPRVQISRLRRNLSLYYARCSPGEGLAVYIRHGDYQLRLAPPESAYGEQRQRSVRQAPANDAAPAPDAPAAMAPPSPPAPGQWSRTPLLAAALYGALAVGSLWLVFSVRPAESAGVPPFDVRIEEPAGAADPLLVLAGQQADDIASNSHVVRNRRPEERNGEPGYVVRLSRSQSMAGRPVLDVELFDDSNQRLFHTSIPIVDDRSVVLARLHGALLQIVNPAGLIAQRELAEIDGEPRSDYECVLRTETDRLEGGLTTAMVESCLERFPDSEYRAYWLSRMAFMGYRDQVLSGGVVAASGAPWQNLQQALAADATNPFANYMAAKVSIAQGDCEAARPYFERTLTNGNYSGVMTAATVAEAALCPGGLTPDHEAGARIASLVEAIPDPNALLYAYLIFATAAVDRPDLTRRLLATPISEDPQGSMADIHAALEAALASPAAFEENRDRLEQVLGGFFWEAAVRQRMMDKLAAVAAYRD